MDAKEKVRAFLSRMFRNQSLADDENILDSNFVNSLFAMQLVLFIEKEFGIEIPNESLNPDNFSSINSICALINARVNG